MSENSNAFSAETYLNPVYPRSFPDPFILKFRGEYFAYCTDFWEDGQVFGVLRSRDLVNWTEIGGAMPRLETPDTPFYWAPEVTYANGKFYLYYSVGNEALMEIRVAVSDRPDGGFEDSGRKLTREDFAIDAHLFTDEDGTRYLFYATDFLHHTHIGTGTVVDRMLDFFTLEGRARPVTRARYDWQVYDPARKEKGGVRWHTVEGPFILKRKNLYYEMFSGGNWQNITYGVSFAVTDDINRDEEWTQFADGEKILPILRTLPELVVGPGHNSVIRGPNNRELLCVYHRWTEGGRTLSIDRMDFAGSRIFIRGASFTPQIAPFRAAFTDFFDRENVGENWSETGLWKISNNQAVCQISEQSELLCQREAESFLCEFSLRAVETSDDTSAFGFCLYGENQKTFEFLIAPKLKRATVFRFGAGAPEKQTFPLGEDFAGETFHLLRVEVDGLSVKFALDEAAFRFEKLLEKSSAQIALVARHMRAAFSGFAVTGGFEELFDWPQGEIEKRGWQKSPGESVWEIKNCQLFLAGQNDSETILAKGAARADFEFAVNVRFEAFNENFAFGFLLLDQKGAVVSRLSIQGAAENFYLTDDARSFKFRLPKSFMPENYHQFRFLKSGGKLLLQLEEIDLGEISAPPDEAKIALFCQNCAVACEMARLTYLSSAKVSDSLF